MPIRKIIVLILCLAGLRGVIYMLVIPFDRSPDEFAHFSLIKARQLALRNAGADEIEAVTFQIGRARYQLMYPDSTRQLSDEDLILFSLENAPPLRQMYYTLNALVLHVLSLNQIRDEVYVLRSLSICLGTLVVGLAFLCMRELFPQNPGLQIAVPFLIAFIPQFSAMNASITNDKLAEVFIALAFLLLVRIFKYGLSWRSGVLFLVTVGVAMLSKRSAVFMVPLCVVAIVVYLWNDALGVRFHLAMIAGLAGFLLTVYLLIKHVKAVELLFVKYVVQIYAYQLERILFRKEIVSLAALKQYAKFFVVMYWSFWALFGYMTIHLHHFWYLMVAAAQALAIGGCAQCIWRVKRHTQVMASWTAKTLYVFGAGIFWAVAIPFVRSNIIRPGNPELSQGRYLFLVILPVCVLTVFGLHQLIPARFHRMTGLLGLLGLLILDSVCLSRQLLLNFHSITFF